MFLNILVLVDGSPDAEEALSQAIDLAKSEHSWLTVLTAIAPPPPTAALAGRSQHDGSSSDPPALHPDEPCPRSMFAWQARGSSP
jgi:nucleotide-binding universal stress UspA family protein